MVRRLAPGALGLLTLAAGACSSGTTVGADSGADTASDAGPDSNDGPLEALGGGLTGVRAFDVTTTLPGGTVHVGTGLATTKVVPIPTTQALTLVLDADRGVAFITSRVLPVIFDGRLFHAGGTVTVQASADEAAISYAAFTFAVDDGGHLAGTARAQVLSDDVPGEPPVTVDLGSAPIAGDADVTAPTFPGLPTTKIDPLALFDLSASEPLPLSSRIRLLGAAGDSVTYAPAFADVPLAVSLFAHPKIALGYGETYHLDTQGLVDFAGNAAAGFSFETMAAPPLIAADGFESAPAGAFAGATVIDDTVPFPPVTAGARSWYLGARYTGTEASCATLSGARVAVRLAVPVDAQVITFTSVSLSANSTPLSVGNVAYGAAGGPVGAWNFGGGAGPFTTHALPNGATVYVGAPQTISIPLPPDLTEIAVELSPDLAECPPAGIPYGFILDDLRVE